MSGKPDALAAVRSCYSTWGQSYYDEYYGPAAPYPPVHVDLVRRLLDEAAPRRLLDAGCGPASMLRQLAAPGRDLYGFDLTPEMVAEGRLVMSGMGVPERRVWEGSVLDPASFAPPAEPPEPFDAVISVGVLPHIPAEQDGTVLENLRAALRPGGLAILEARNALFSLFTLNRYSAEMFLDDLIPAARLRGAAGEEGAALEAGLTELRGMFRTDLPPVRKGKAGEPGYDEVLSRVHNPLVLRDLVARSGFGEIRVLFYHFHALPPLVGAKVPHLFRRESLAMEANPEDWRGYLMASAFLIAARRV